MKYSLVIPVYNEELNIKPLYKRITKVIKQLSNNYELIFINDGSTDKTEVLLKQLYKTDKKVKIINFSRNYGHQTAVTAGLNFVNGDSIAILDADLQDPPEVLPKFFKKLKDGYDVIYAIRTKRKEGLLKRLAYSLFYRLLKLVANINIPLDTGDFCVMNRKVANIINTMPERNRFLRGLRSWVGFKQMGIEYERKSRHAGQSKYPFHKLLKLALDGIFSFSYVPLQILTWLGFSFLVFAIAGILITFYAKLFTNIFIPRGFPTTIIVILFIGGLNMFSLGLIGEYIGRIYDEVKQRPQYIIASKIGFKSKK